jgi:cytoskeleton protein RodZ
MMSSAEHGQEGLARFGADLQTARHRLGWDLPAVAASLRIRLPYLEALEDGRIADLPGNAYAVGFLRTYAGALGLDPDEMARRFRAEANVGNRKTELSFPAPVPERGVPAGVVVLLGVVLAIGGYIGWYRMSGDAAHRTEPVTAVPDRLATLADVPPPPAAAVTSTASPAPGTSAAATGAAPEQDKIAAAPSVTPPTPQIATAVPATTAPATPPAAQPASALAPDAGRMVLRAKADAWMQVRDKQGQVLLNRVLRAGDTWPVPNLPNHPQLLLTTGNAGGTEILVDGTVAPGFGANGVVRRDIPLDADAIKAGRLPIQIASGAAPTAPGSTVKPAAQ